MATTIETRSGRLASMNKEAEEQSADASDPNPDSPASSPLMPPGVQDDEKDCSKDTTESRSPPSTDDAKSEQKFDPELGYVPLLENEYVFVKPNSQKDLRRMACDCTLTKDEISRGIMGCVDDCLNRLLMIECGARCSLGDNCGNRRFQRKEFAKVERFQAEQKGFGLRAQEPLPAGMFVMEYVGEVLSPTEFKRRVKKYDSAQHFYFMALRPDQVIDATSKGNLSRHMNHSCDPNCETQKWTVNGDLRVGFFTKRAVRAGEELTFDYQFEVYGKEAQKCYCGSENCRGVIGRQVARQKKEERKSRIEEEIDEEEVDDLEEGGLKSRKDILNLCRIMVRAEDADIKCRLLDIIAGTAHACLKLFLDYHGLTLLWSWFVDLTGYELREKMISTLDKLPVTNKTALKDSKLLGSVHQLASDLSDELEALRKTEQDSEKIQPHEEMYKNVSLLLDKWNALKEVYRIPKLEQQRRKEDEKEVDRREKEIKKAKKDERKEKPEKEERREKSDKDREREIRSRRRSRGRSRSRSRSHSPRGRSRKRSRSRSRSRSHSRERSRRHRRSRRSRSRSRSSSSSSSRERYHKHQQKISKEERRRLFALQVQRSDEIRLRQEMLQKQIASMQMMEAPVTLTPMFRDENGRFVPVPPELLKQLPPPMMVQPPLMQMPNAAAAAAAPLLPAHMGGAPTVTNFDGAQTYGSAFVQSRSLAPSALGPVLNQGGIPVGSPSLNAHVVPPGIASVPAAAIPAHLNPSYITQTPTDPVQRSEEAIPPKMRLVRLAKFWKVAKTEEGQLYFYNSITRDTSWVPPEESPEESEIISEPTTIVVPTTVVPTPTPVVATVMPPSMFVVDAGEVEGDHERRVKENFMMQISQYIVNILQPYRREDCVQGRITTDDDFKKLARKLTHCILSKESRQCKNTDSLEVNETVRHKTRDFVVKYMRKFGEVFVYNSKKE
ncbi:histone-lysine N-methyltransferase SETD2 [Galendromus occidentalis]|uniref:[histone H3]-lysine(36) N-trimethyltransferase n=1 Tax=Galendromus occidentalis TaxID=34638 RepID=A0AAJ7SGQ5_9ACAR|nr:histone-lysine N-methyltransferase SETD2 [Galendromus occidentalis]